MKPLLAFLLAFTIPISAQVLSGADILLKDRLDLIKGKRLGVVTNHSALLKDGRHLVDALAAVPGVKIVALFGPEHGIRGDAPDGRSVRDTVDAKTGVPMYSLYGRINKPTPEMLRGVDVLVFDIQDVGARFYTFISTMSHAMEAAAENDIPYVVLDRPNPIRGTWVEGPIRVDTLRSFVGLHPIPIAHGMTVGELATMFNEEGWLANGAKAKLTVVTCVGWRRDQWYDQTGLAWVKPSPNMATLTTATVYPGTCLFEGTNLSEGRGVEKPFETIGAPYVDGEAWAKELNARSLPGVRFEPVRFTPREIPNVASRPKHQGAECGGVALIVTDREKLQPVRTAVHMLSTIKQLAGEKFQWRNSSIDRLSGTPALRLAVDAGKPADEIVNSWKPETEQFGTTRTKYLLY
ncbi:MAG: DUF1343 domain-containing protein [Bacteroidetes bacterium]|jgi:uncharacterized protein YbbC (DUF1343 family)|nr:DUF1343 domain-containing protein [Bacteroidota bacterium]